MLDSDSVADLDLDPPRTDDLPGPDDPADVAIVGGGPIGLELGIRLRTAGVRTIQFEAGPIGATIGWWAPGTRFFSSPERIAIAGVPIPSEDQSKTTRERYLAYLRAVVRQFDLPVHAWRRVTRIDGDLASGFRLAVRPSEHGVGGPQEWARVQSGGDEGGDDASAVVHAHARRVVLAIGDMHRPSRLEIPGEELAHVSHWFGEPHEFFGRRVLVVGGKNSAVEAALRLYRAGVRVGISYRGEAFDARRVKYWLRPEIEWLIERGRIDWWPRTVPTAIGPDFVDLSPVEGSVAGAGAGGVESTRVAADRVLLLTGYRQDASLFEQVGVRLGGEERTPEFDRATMETNVPGVHVAGTACGGSQRRARYYIENSHVHVDRIVAAVTGRDVAISDPDFAALEES